MKKYYIFILISFLFIGIFDVKASKPLNNTIVIDPGHGGLDPGTTYKDIYEKDINLSISLFLKEELEKKGSKVILTRLGDYDLSKPNALYRKKSDFDNRIQLINNFADYYISIHLNYLNNTKYYGAQVFSLNDSIDAKLVQDNLNKKFNFNRDSKVIPKDTYMYQKLIKPGLLIECGFLSNPSERKRLLDKNYQKELAKEIANSVIKIIIKKT